MDVPIRKGRHVWLNHDQMLVSVSLHEDAMLRGMGFPAGTKGRVIA